jgi:hypothetical protein
MSRSGRYAQRVAHQFALVDGTCSFGVGRADFEAHDMGKPQAQLGCVFDRDDSLGGIDTTGQRV